MNIVKSNLKISLLIIWILATFLMLYAVGIYNSAATDGQKFYDLMVLKEQLQLENTLLENQIASRSSLLYISEQAKLAGFIPAKKVEFITTY